MGKKTPLKTVNERNEELQAISEAIAELNGRLERLSGSYTAAERSRSCFVAAAAELCNARFLLKSIGRSDL